MSSEKQSTHSRWSRRKTVVATTLVGWVPLAPGMRLRNLAYRSICRRIGNAVKIQAGVDFRDASCIAIGNGVMISQGVYIDVAPGNEVEFDKRVYLDRHVRITCTGQGGKVCLRQQVSLDCGVNLKVHQAGKTEIGDRTYIGPYTCLSGYGDIKIGKDCLIASHSAIYAHNYNFANPTRKIGDQGFNHQGITLEDNCWLGAGVRVLDGVTIGQGSVIGAGAVVTKDIPPYSVAVGVPAKVISRRTRDQAPTDNCLENISITDI